MTTADYIPTRRAEITVCIPTGLTLKFVKFSKVLASITISNSIFDHHADQLDI